MKLNQIAANRTTVEFNNGIVVFFSYNTPVAACTPTDGFIRTENKFSVTTSKHITQWLDGRHADLVAQDYIEGLVGAA